MRLPASAEALPAMGSGCIAELSLQAVIHMAKTDGLRAVKLSEIPRDQRLQAARRVAREGTHEPADLITAALFPSDKLYFVRAQAFGELPCAA